MHDFLVLSRAPPCLFCFDTFCPVGPRVVTDLDPFNTRVRCFVDGELRQDGTTSDMIFDVPTILSDIQQRVELQKNG